MLFSRSSLSLEKTLSPVSSSFFLSLSIALLFGIASLREREYNTRAMIFFLRAKFSTLSV